MQSQARKDHTECRACKIKTKEEKMTFSGKKNQEATLAPSLGRKPLRRTVRDTDLSPTVGVVELQ